MSERIMDLVARGYRALYDRAQSTGHWGQVRSSALAVLCLHRREPAESKWLLEVRDWLTNRADRTPEGHVCWNDETWDTALALIALRRLGLDTSRPEISGGIAWLLSHYDRTGRRNWHDEPWETSWALSALFEVRGTGLWDAEAARGALGWLAGMVEEDGRLVAPHYTAYFVRLAHIWSAGDGAETSPEDGEPLEAAGRARRYLLDSCAEERLWTGEPWSNGQVVWCLSEAGATQLLKPPFRSRIVGWFDRHLQAHPHGWGDTTNTASSLLGLISLLNLQYGSERPGHLRTDLQAAMKAPPLRKDRPLHEFTDDDYLAIYVSPRRRRQLKAFVPVATAIAGVIAFWEYVAELLGYLLRVLVGLIP